MPNEIEDLKAKVEELTNTVAVLEKENDALATANVSLKAEVETLRKGLSLSSIKDLSPELREIVNEKMQAGLSPKVATEVAFRQLAKNQKLAKAKKDAVAPKPEAEATPKTKK